MKRPGKKEANLKRHDSSSSLEIIMKSNDNLSRNDNKECKVQMNDETNDVDNDRQVTNELKLLEVENETLGKNPINIPKSFQNESETFLIEENEEKK